MKYRSSNRNHAVPIPAQDYQSQGVGKGELNEL